jgi:hypothetical protein
MSKKKIKRVRRFLMEMKTVEFQVIEQPAYLFLHKLPLPLYKIDTGINNNS